ncbi:Piwi domain-containing protein [Mycena filopes]|nr:Piwi domain-containing protein [Mycena filopes]
MAALSASDVARFGSSGRHVSATVNVFELSMRWDQGQEVYHYSVGLCSFLVVANNALIIAVLTEAFQPLWQQKNEIKIGVAKNRELIARLQTLETAVFQPIGAYDGKANLFSFKDYNINPGRDFIIPFDPDRGPTRSPPKQIRVTLTLVRRVNLSVLRRLEVGESGDRDSALNLLNVFIQANPRTQYPSLYGRNTVFTSNDDRDRMSIAPLELWMGIFQSVRPTLRSIAINVDVQAGVVVPQESLPSFCERYLKVGHLTHLNNDQFQSLRMFLRGIKITVHTPGRPERVVRIKDIVRDVGTREFEMNLPGDQVRTLTVATYFHEVYNHTIIPFTLGVKVRHHELFPVNFCRTVNDLYKNKLPPNFTAEVLKFMPPTPKPRLQKIRQGWTNLEYKNSQFFKEAISTSHRKLRTQPETLKEGGTWDVRDGHLAAPAGTIDNWIFMNCTTSNMQAFVDELRKVLRDRGLQSSPPRYRNVHPNSIERSLASEIRQDRPMLIIAVLPDPAPDLYITVKRFGDITHGIATQCIILKINTRLGGINFIPQSPAMKELFRLRTMVSGGDVSHPGAGSTLPSVAALVSSYDPAACKYTASVEVQASRVEIILNLESMVKTAIQQFVTRTGRPPDRFVYYRDGVSEGQFATVLREEGGAFYRAMKTWEKYYTAGPPPFLFVVCAKNHHIRFFPGFETADKRGNENFPAGFVGDRDIGHPSYNDFYLQSQKGLQGTSRPCHYTVLLNHGTNWIQQISYSLCHVYARATRSVKIPAPVYDADVCRYIRITFIHLLSFSSLSVPERSSIRQRRRLEDDISLSSDDPNYGTSSRFYQVAQF